MHELRLVAVSEDGSYAVLVVPGRGGRFSLPVDDRLRAVARHSPMKEPDSIGTLRGVPPTGARGSSGWTVFK